MVHAQPRGNLNNALIQKVRRHAAIATLFRSAAVTGRLPSVSGRVVSARAAEPAPTGWQLEEAAAPTGAAAEPVIHADGVSGAVRRQVAPGGVAPVKAASQQALAGSSLQTGVVGPVNPPLPCAPLSPAPLPIRPETQLPSQAPIQARAAAQPSTPHLASVPVKEPGVQKSEVGQPAVPNPAPEPSGEMDERTWRRLQRIYQGHQQKQAEDTQLTSPVQKSPADRPPDSEPQPMPETAPGTVPKIVGPSIEETGRNGDAGQTGLPVFRKIEDQAAVPQPGESSLLEKHAPAPAEYAGIGHEDKKSAAATAASEMAQVPAHPGPESIPARIDRAAGQPPEPHLKPIPGNPIEENPASRAVENTGEMRSQQEVGTVPEPEMPIQSVPLNDAWPIQRVDLPEQGLGTPPVVSAAPQAVPSASQPLAKPLDAGSLDEDAFTSFSLEENEPPPGQPAEPKAALQVLHHIAPGQRTDSAVEYIAPRGIRPGVIGPRARAAAMPLQRDMKEEAPAGGDVLPRYPVETDIGPLPADLWELIGQAPPGAAAARLEPPASGAVLTGEPAPGKDAARAPEIAAAGHPAREPALQEKPPVERSVLSVLNPQSAALGETGERSTNPLTPAAVQRQPASPEEVSASTPAGNLDQASPPALEKAVDNAVDMDELARQVYSEIHRRLLTEWERIRRHL